MSVKTYGRTALIGGTSGALDEYDADNLNEGDRCLTVLSTGKYYFHRLNASSGAAESSPDVVKPDSGGGTSPYTGDKRWVLTELGNLAPMIHGASAKATPVDADEIGLIDSAASWVLKKLTWSNIKATLKTYFDTLYNNYSLENHASNHTDGTDDIQNATDAQKGLATLTQITKLDAIEASADVTDAINVGSSTHGVANKATPVNADKVPSIDTEDANTLKTSTWTNIKAFLKTYFDTLYNLYSHPNHTGPVTSSGDGATIITDKAVTLPKMADMATASLLGRNTAASGVPEVLSKATTLSLLNVVDGADVTGSNAPQAHKTGHQNGGADEINVGGLSGLLADDQHVLDTEVKAAAVSDDVYAAGWNTVTDVAPSKNAVYDKIEAMGGGLANVVEDTTPQLGGNLDMNGMSIGGNTEAQLDDAVAKKHTQGTDTSLGIQNADINMGTHKLTALSIPSANGQSVRTTTKITEVSLEDAADKKHAANGDTDLDATFEATFMKKADNANALADITSTGANIEDAVTKKHTQGSDTALGAQAENLDMNTHKIVDVVDPTANQDAATKKYVDDNAGEAHALVAKTANYNVQAADLTGLKTFTNDGAGGEITFTLPAGSANYRVGFIVTDAQYLKVIANGTEKFRYGATQGAAGGYIRCNVVGSAWIITWTGDDWLISPLSGVLKYDE